MIHGTIARLRGFDLNVDLRSPLTGALGYTYRHLVGDEISIRPPGQRSLPLGCLDCLLQPLRDKIFSGCTMLLAADSAVRNGDKLVTMQAEPGDVLAAVRSFPMAGTLVADWSDKSFPPGCKRLRDDRVRIQQCLAAEPVLNPLQWLQQEHARTLVKPQIAYEIQPLTSFFTYLPSPVVETLWTYWRPLVRP